MLRNINNERNVIIESIISICLAGIAGTTYMYENYCKSDHYVL